MQVELAGDDDGGRATALERVAGSARCSSRAAPCTPARANGAAAIPAVLAALEAHGVRAARTLARPSLDDVYLRHAGRAYAA